MESENTPVDNQECLSTASTLFSIPEHELRACPETPEHQAVCLAFTVKRLHQLGFQLPNSLTGRQQLSCKAVLLGSEDDVLFMFKFLLDEYERVREERNDLRASDKVLKHDLGRAARRSASLERELTLREKKLADAEYRLEEQKQQTERLRADAKREAQRARLAQSNMQRMEALVKHKQCRTERELFDAKQRLEKVGRGYPLGSWPGGRRKRALHRDRSKSGGDSVVTAANSKTAAAGAAGATLTTSANHATVVASDLFDAVELPPLTQKTRGRAGRNRSLPPAQVWYKVPTTQVSISASSDGYGDDRGGVDDISGDASGGGAGGEQSTISLADTIDASGFCLRASASSSRCSSTASTATIGMPGAVAARERRGEK